MSLKKSFEPAYLPIGAALLVASAALVIASGVVLANPLENDSFPSQEARAMAYFAEIGFGAEYASVDEVLHKWQQEVRIKIHGEPTKADLETLEQVVGELNDLLGGVGLILTQEAANVDLYFSPESGFPAIEPAYVPVNLGFFRVWFDEQGAIHRGRILIASQGTTQVERSHLIREELTQSLGIFKDSWHYSDSIFYEGWTTTTEYGPLDGSAIRLLYSSLLEPGMTRVQVQSVFSRQESNRVKVAAYSSFPQGEPLGSTHRMPLLAARWSAPGRSIRGFRAGNSCSILPHG